MRALILGLGVLALQPVFAQEILTERGELPGEATDRSAWQLEANARSYKSLAEYTDWIGVVGGEISYNRIKDLTVTAALDYAFQYDTAVSVTEQTAYGLQDLQFTALYKDLLSGPIRSLRPVAQVYLPTSETSQNATMMTTVGAGVSYSQKERFFNWGTNHLVLGSLYQYETSNAFGSSYNTPLGMSNGVNISRSFNPITIVGSYSLYTYYTYSDRTKNLQTFLLSTNWLVNPRLSVTGYYRWRDDIISDLSAFDDDTSIAGLSLTYTM